MAISGINRDWGVDPSIVRIASTNTLAEVSEPNYILEQTENIELANDGQFQWSGSDVVLVAALDAWGLFTISGDFSSLNPFILPGNGDVDGPASATDDALVRFDGTTGKLIKNSTATLTDAGTLSVTNLNLPTTTSETSGVINQNGVPLLNTYNNNLFLGLSAGNFSLGLVCQRNIGIGLNTLDGLTTGTDNCIVAYQSGALITSGFANAIFAGTPFITTGTHNSIFGVNSGVNYTGAESSNILIANEGIEGESNTCHIGQTGAGAQQITAMYLYGNTINMPDASLEVFGDVSSATLHVNGAELILADSFTTSGAFPVTQTYSGPTNVTFPTTGTLATTTDIGAYLPLTGGTITGQLSLSSSQDTGLTLNINNTSINSAQSPFSKIFLQTLQAGGEDPLITFLIAGSPQVPLSLGLDNTDDNFKIVRGFSLSGTSDLTLNTTTGAFSFAQTIGGNISGNAATVTTNANLTGDVTSVGNATTYNNILPISKGGTNANNAATTGTILRGNGTAFVPTTTTYPDTNAINTIQYASSANVMGSVSAQNNAVLQTSASGVPSMSVQQTYSPTIGDGTNNFTTSAASGWYYRMGGRTFVNINITWTNKGSASAGSTLRISLPAASAVTPGSNTFTFGFVNGITSTTQIFAFTNGGDNYIQLVSFSSGGSATSILVSGAASSGQIQLSGWYGS